jgi:hypothetical protein
MDIPGIKFVITEIYRVLKDNGFLQFSIAYPCFNTPMTRNVRDKNGITYAMEISDYFAKTNGKIAEWIFSATPPEIADRTDKFKVPYFTFTINEWFKLLINTGFFIEKVNEPRSGK